jgi:hypothetical protein
VSKIKVQIPANYKAAMNSPEKEHWQAAIDKEISSLSENGTFKVENNLQNKKTISTKWVFSLKLDESGTQIHKYKARLVARGLIQIAGIDYQDIFAPVVSQNALRITNAICFQKGYKQRKYDVATAFLNGYMDHLCYIDQPEGTNFKMQKGQVLRLIKALYGTKQAARMWNQLLHELLIKIGFTQNAVEVCLYQFKDRNMFLIIYVDDVSTYFKFKLDAEWFEEELSKAFKLGEASVGNMFLGMHLEIREESLGIHQERYIQGMIITYGQEDSNPTSLPMAVGVDLEIRESDEAIGERPYAEIIGSLLYAARSTRPDINFAVSALARYVSRPKAKHFRAAVKILQYLASTRTVGIIYTRIELMKNEQSEKTRKTDINLLSDLKLVAYVDADWATCKEDRISQTGYIIFMMNGPVIWRSRKQKSVALSTMEAEFMALSDAVKEIIWIRALLLAMGYELDQATTIYEDNNACIELARDPKHRERAKHIDIRYHFIRDHDTKKHIKIEKIETELQLADGLTKALPIERFNKLNKLSGIADTCQNRGVSRKGSWKVSDGNGKNESSIEFVTEQE